MKKMLTYILIGTVVLFIVGFILWFTLCRAARGDWNKTFTRIDDNDVQAIVHGYTHCPLNGWTAELLWKKSDDKWFVYYLNHDSYFEKYELKTRGDHIDVFCDGNRMGDLDTSTAEFFHIRQNLRYKDPVDIIHGNNLHDREKWTHWTDGSASPSPTPR
jgi:hypothetical protein